MLTYRMVRAAALLLVICCLTACGIETDVLPAPATATPHPATATPLAPSATPSATVEPSPTTVPSPTATATPIPLTLSLSPELPPGYVASLNGLLEGARVTVNGIMTPLEIGDAPAQARLYLAPLAEVPADERLATRVLAVVAPFQALPDDISLAEILSRWSDPEGHLLTTAETIDDLLPVLGPYAGEPLLEWDLLPALEADPQALGLLPFDRLDPTYKVLTIDGVDPLDNHLLVEGYPLSLALAIEGNLPQSAHDLLAERLMPLTNRDPERLTCLIMTGVTAMCRLTAERMEHYGVLYPALVISDTLRAADITHVSNEVPFIRDCPVNTASNNLIFCSDYDYWGALEAIGADIVGLSGNHVNDFGYDGARESIAFYRDRGIPIYGSGLNLDEACAPIFVSDHGNEVAFLATLAWNPQSAWATEDLPGTCYFYDHKERILETIRSLSQQVDILAVELQYLETYNPFPTEQQVDEFRELRAAGADIVTGVQSHVPQAWEPDGQDDAGGNGIIVYGLGNLFFDQMWSWETRTGLIACHTLYDGRLISSQILTTVLEDAAQPRWATPDERTEILTRIHQAAPERVAE